MSKNKSDKIEQSISAMKIAMEKIINDNPKPSLDQLHYYFLDQREETLSKIEYFKSIDDKSNGKSNYFKVLKDIIQDLQKQNDIQKRQIDELDRKLKEKNEKK